MKAVLWDVSPGDLARRRRLGLDRWDEMWEGVLHMAPAPADEHQRIVGELAGFLIPLFKRKRHGTLRIGVNVFNRASAEEDYRIPDFSFVAPGREKIIGPQGIEGGPDAVIEVRSPGDETHEKFDFFAKLGVREIVVIDRDAKTAEVHRLAGARYPGTTGDPGGGVFSETLDVRFRTVSGSPPRLHVEDRADASASVEI